MLGPSLNVHRVPRNGRNAEYISGEDPYLGALLVPAYVSGVQSEGVAAVAKHFALNHQETERGHVSAGHGRIGKQQPLHHIIISHSHSITQSHNLYLK